jgi:TonB family protein
MPDDKYILLQKWVRNETTAREEARLAAWAREDSFLADALEGYAGLPEADHAQRLERLKKRLADPRESRKPILTWWPRLAAAAAVLLLAVAGFWWINSDRGPAEVAQEMEAPPPEPEAAPPPPAERTTRPPEEEKVMVPEQPAKAKKEAKRAPPADEQVADRERPARAEAKQKTNPPVSPPAQRTPPGTLAEERTEAALSIQADTAPVERILSGLVTNAEGDPLVGATVFLPRPERIATTDLNGYFKLTIPDTATAELIVSYTGFQSRRIIVPDTSFQRIALEPGSAPLSAARAQTPRQPAEPMGGYFRFEQYLDAAKRYPPQAAEKDIRGTVVLSFQVDENGRPQDIRIEQSLGYGCDTEAMRLLQEGPDWVPPTSSRTRLPIAFP